MLVDENVSFSIENVSFSNENVSFFPLKMDSFLMKMCLSPAPRSVRKGRAGHRAVLHSQNLFSLFRILMKSRLSYFFIDNILIIIKKCCFW